MNRMLRPSSVAVIGGGAWGRAVLDQLERIRFRGRCWHVHPRDGDLARIEHLPTAPDAAFIGINRDATITAVDALSRMGAGGAVCFASGFAEAEAPERQAALVDAANGMPILGPNCYGILNAFDRVAIWPDQHGLCPVERGVAVITQSSNIAINLSMQRRGLPIGYVLTCGNQAQTGQAEIACALLEDSRVSAIGLHIEGFRDIRSWESLAREAERRGIPLVALKVGASDAARAATVSHTASIAGSAAGSRALLDRLGIRQVNDLAAFVETLKILHVCGPLPSRRVGSISCSGGEAALAADTGHRFGLEFPPLGLAQKTALNRVLGSKVTLANPLDYHTYVWRDTERMAEAWRAMMLGDTAMTVSIVDYPRDDRCEAADWACATEAALAARAQSGRSFAVLATLPELMPEAVAIRFMAAGVVPLCGLEAGFAAIRAAGTRFATTAAPLLLPTPSAMLTRTVSESQAKERLAAHGLCVPGRNIFTRASDASDAVARLTPPYVLKVTGTPHKSDEGGVVTGLVGAAAVADAAGAMGTGPFLVEEMVRGGVAELLIGVVKDPAHGFVLTLGAGGIHAEILEDSVSLLVPSERSVIADALSALRCAPLLAGYRGASAACMNSILDSIEAIQVYVVANAGTVEEVEVNPLICTPTRAIAVDALIREASP